MVEKHNLFDKVKLLGELKHADVKTVLNQGQIFLNCSLTEAFCIALIEAASCGLMCVSTRVGGVPEVLPPEMVALAEPEPASILGALEEALAKVPFIAPWEFHENVRRFYSWDWVAERTEKVYERVVTLPRPSMHTRLLEFSAVGKIYGIVCMALAALDWLFLQVLEFLVPPSDID